MPSNHFFSVLLLSPGRVCCDQEASFCLKKPLLKMLTDKLMLILNFIYIFFYINESFPSLSFHNFSSNLPCYFCWHDSYVLWRTSLLAKVLIIPLMSVTERLYLVGKESRRLGHVETEKSDSPRRATMWELWAVTSQEGIGELIYKKWELTPLLKTRVKHAE